MLHISYLGLLVLYVLFILIDRWLVKSGAPVKALFNDKPSKTYIPSTKKCFKIFGLAILWRICIFLFGCIIIYSMSKDNIGFTLNNAVNQWRKWDAFHYIRISEGYSSYVENGDYPTLVFFPMYPFFLKLLRYLIPNEMVAGILVSSISYALACVFLYKLVALDYGKRVAKYTVILLSIFPFSYFLGAVMSESTYLLFSVLTLYYIRKHKWLRAGIFGYCTALSRMIGFILIIPATIEICEEYEVFKHIKEFKYLLGIFFKKFIPLLLIPCGTLTFLYCNYHITGDWFYFIKMEEKYFANAYEHFFCYLYKTSGYLRNSSDIKMIFTMWLPYFIIVLVSYLVLIFSVRKHRTMYSTYLLGYIIINTSLSWAISVGRYFSCAVPLFIFIANMLERKTTLRNLVVIFSSCYLGITLSQFLIYGGIP